MALITLSRKDPEFKKYLEGSFSKTERALPLTTLNVNSESESVTFNVVPVAEIQKPDFLRMWMQVFKFRSFLILAFPIFVILTKNIFDGMEMDADLIIYSVLSAFSLLVGANLLNDYFDHMRGLDRVHPDSERKPIQRGWVTAKATRTWAGIYLGLGVLLGLPAVFIEPQIILLVAAPAAVALWAWLNPQRGLRFRRGAEVMVFFLGGPLFAMGFQWAVSGVFDLETLWIGAMSGWIAVFLLHLKNFNALMVNTQAKFESSIVRLGFEKSKILLSFWWGALWLSFCAYEWIYFDFYQEWFWASLAVALASSAVFIRKLWTLKSPLSSDLKSLVQSGRAAVVLFWGWWMLQCFWILVVAELSGVPLELP